MRALRSKLTYANVISTLCLFLVLGGELPPGHTFPENEAYDPKANAWRTLSPMPGGRHATAAATDGDHVYLAAGTAGLDRDRALGDSNDTIQ